MDAKARKFSKNAPHIPYQFICDSISQWTVLPEQYPFNHNLPGLINAPGGLVHYLDSKHAIYHKACCSSINSQKLDRAKKRVTTEDLPALTKKKTRLDVSATSSATTDNDLSSKPANVFFSVMNLRGMKA